MVGQANGRSRSSCCVGNRVRPRSIHCHAGAPAALPPARNTSRPSASASSSSICLSAKDLLWGKVRRVETCARVVVAIIVMTNNVIVTVTVNIAAAA